MFRFSFIDCGFMAFIQKLINNEIVITESIKDISFEHFSICMNEYEPFVNTDLFPVGQ